jgi:hypothetical protein
VLQSVEDEAAALLGAELVEATVEWLSGSEKELSAVSDQLSAG